VISAQYDLSGNIVTKIGVSYNVGVNPTIPNADTRDPVFVDFSVLGVGLNPWGFASSFVNDGRFTGFFNITDQLPGSVKSVPSAPDTIVGSGIRGISAFDYDMLGITARLFNGLEAGWIFPKFGRLLDNLSADVIATSTPEPTVGYSFDPDDSFAPSQYFGVMPKSDASGPNLMAGITRDYRVAMHGTGPISMTLPTVSEVGAPAYSVLSGNYRAVACANNYFFPSTTGVFPPVAARVGSWTQFNGFLLSF
jgi:hypothetical protein